MHVGAPRHARVVHLGGDERARRLGGQQEPQPPRGVRAVRGGDGRELVAKLGDGVEPHARAVLRAELEEPDGLPRRGRVAPGRHRGERVPGPGVTSCERRARDEARAS